MTLKVSGISAKAALDLLLDSFHLAATIRDEVLLITSERIADGNVRTVVYDVADLALVEAGHAQTNAKTPRVVKEQETKTDGDTLEPDFDQLIDMITGSISPCTWDNVGGIGSIRPFDTSGIRAIVVTQTR